MTQCECEWHALEREESGRRDRGGVRRYVYRRYLASPEWGFVAEAVRGRAAGGCERCGGPGLLQVDHKTYDHIYHEGAHLGDLQAICRPCHEYKSGVREEDPIWNREFEKIQARDNKGL